MQTSLFTRAKERLKANTVLANSIEEVESILKDATAEKGGGKFVMAHIKDDPVCDARLKEFKATVRNIPLVDEYDGPGKCIVTGETVDAARRDRQSRIEPSQKRKLKSPVIVNQRSRRYSGLARRNRGVAPSQKRRRRSSATAAPRAK